MQHHYLYEHRTRIKLLELGIDVGALNQHLQQLWDNRPRTPSFWRAPDDDSSTVQRFLRFHAEDGTVSARNYVGQIHFEGHMLHLLPKVFYPGEELPDTIPDDDPRLQAMHAHLFWWLSYAHKLRFPRSLATFSALPTNLLEVLILLFAQYTHELLSRTHYQHYQEVSEDLGTLRGHLNFGTYATYYATGQGHRLPCTFDSFQPDNRFNRILKYVAYQLLNHTKQTHTQQLLQEIHFQLDEVADQLAVLNDCDQVQLSPLFDDFRVVLDYCRLFLADSGPLAAHTEEVRVFAILLPTEVIFEEFIEGFIRTHLAAAFHVSAQTRDLYLATATPHQGKKTRYFQLRHDLLLSRLPAQEKTKPLVIDTKYKTLPVTASGSITPGSVAQADMYQLVSYALRRGTPYTHLFYPDSLRHPAADIPFNRLDYLVEDKLSGVSSSISVSAHRLPVTAPEAFVYNAITTTSISKAIHTQESILMSRLNTVLSAH
ncbi:McrC family protein [Hymenobacter sp. DH14]|uniref:McrC family protein n=1 Tax=Hymenobacter cyanobacteriorum TaxID=2926463 RepID=A0A9X2AGD8_9BACT|nr:McrC family protein [Hymenobacter cyanobacteriorum]MCI1188737.1 McrC family protein [Hymenobacter cyanobacteriorum]